MKKILYITQYFPPETGAGATRSEAMVKYLTKNGLDIEVISELPNYPTGKIYPGFKNVFHQSDEYHSTKIHRVWVWANPRSSILEQIGIFSSFLLTSLLYVIRKPKQYDVVYASSPPIFAGLAGALISKILGTKFVLEIRDIWPDAAVDVGQINKKSSVYHAGHFIERWLYNQADLIIPVTSRSEKIIQARASNTPTEVISNGVDLSLFKKVENPKQTVDEDYDETKFRVGYVGSLGVIHDLEAFVKAAKMCEDDPDIEFIIVGDGRSRGKLEEALKTVNPNNVKWLGLKDHHKIPAYISSFDIAVNPVYNAEIFESIMTVKFYEYMACGTPVISLAKGMMEEQGKLSKGAITLAPGNYEDLAKTIKELKADPEKLAEMADHASRYVSECYSREKLAGDLAEVLENL